MIYCCNSSNPSPVFAEKAMIFFVVIFSISSIENAFSRSDLLYKITAFFDSISFKSILSSSSISRERSNIKIQKSQCFSCSLAFSIPIFSTSSSVSCIPAVSIKCKNTSPILTFSSNVSLVVPGTFVTIARSVPSIAFKKEDFPTLGFPIIAV